MTIKIGGGFITCIVIMVLFSFFAIYRSQGIPSWLSHLGDNAGNNGGVNPPAIPASYKTNIVVLPSRVITITQKELVFDLHDGHGGLYGFEHLKVIDGFGRTLIYKDHTVGNIPTKTEFSSSDWHINLSNSIASFGLTAPNGPVTIDYALDYLQ